MPKRNTTDEILENLSAGDKDAAEAKQKALAAIPDPAWNSSIPFALTYASRIFNVRDEDSYAYESNKDLYRSLKEKGLEKRGDPMAFHFEPDTGLFKVLVGNLRFTMMGIIRQEEIKRRKDAGEPESPETLPFSTIFGLVYTGLTIGQQTAIMADHIGRKDLNEFEKCKEIGEFMEENGLTDAQGAVHFGMDKNKLRRYRMRWAMPTVMAEFRKEKAGKGGTEAYIAIGQKQLEALYSAYTIDRKAGNGHREEGPAFRLAWEKIKADPNAFKPAPKDKEKGPETIGRTDLLNQATGSVAGFGEGFEIKAIADTLRFSAGESVNLNAVRQTAKDEADKLRSEVARLGKERDDFATMIETLRTEVESLKSEIRDRDEHIVTMRAELDRIGKARKAGNNSR